MHVRRVANQEVHYLAKSYAILREIIYQECFTNCVKPLDLGLDEIHGGLQNKEVEV